MAIIRCPECGHSVSDMAPVCPSCGVEIAGRIITCPQCGTAYFKNQPECPACHHLTAASQQQAQTTTPPPAPTAEQQQALQQATTQHEEELLREREAEARKKSNRRIVIVSFVIAVIAMGVCYAFYSSARNSKESEAYEYAMGSKDPMVLQSYLDTYKDAPEAHLDSIQAHLDLLRQLDRDWTDACITGTRNALEQYIERHPDSPYKQQAMHKLDSIDWTTAQGANTVEAFETYLEQHPTGDYADMANDNIKSLNANTVQPEEQLMVSTAFRDFFTSLNNKDEDMLTSSVAQLLTSFLGKPNATRSDVVTFMHKIYKPTVESMRWTSSEDYNISKKEIGDQQYEYTVSFAATQAVHNTDGTTTNNKYKIVAKLNPDGQISDLKMTKIVE